MIPNDTINHFVDTINKQRESLQNELAIKARANTTPTPTHTSIADELLKFKQLLDIGAITEDEFNKKKSELLQS